ncbi:unnamed protein product, partial [Allacma fusca]
MKDSDNSSFINSGWMPDNETIQNSSEEFEYIFDMVYVKILFIFLYTVVFCFCFFGNLAVVLVHNCGVLTKKISSKGINPSLDDSIPSRKNSDNSSSSERRGTERLCCKIFPLCYIEKTLKSQAVFDTRDQVKGNSLGVEDAQELKTSPV